VTATHNAAVPCHEAISRVTASKLLAPLLSFPVLLGTLLVAAVFFGTISQETKTDTLFSEGDTWWHIRVGQDILAARQLPHTDRYSWTAAGTPWIAYEWLGEVGIAEAYRFGNLQGLRALQLMLAGAMLVLIYIYASMRSENPKAAFVVCAAIVPIVAGFCSLRPQLFGYICFVIVLLILEQFRRGQSHRLWFLPLLFWLWVNTHGTFVFGFIALAVSWAGGLPRWRLTGIESFVWSRTQRIQLEIVTLISLLAVLFTPYGTQLAAYPFDIGLLQPKNIANIQEWMPITAERFLAVTVLVLLLMFLVSKILLRFRCRLDDLVFVCVGAVAAFMHLRFVPLFLLVTVPLLALPLTLCFSPYRRDWDRIALNAALIAIVAAALIHFFPSKQALQKACAEHFPVAALQHLAASSTSGHFFNEYGWGGYLESVNVPSHGVFIDGRADIYERTGVLGDYLSIARLEPNAFQLLRKYDIRTCLLRTDSPLTTVLAALPDWTVAYSDKVASIYVRRSNIAVDGDLHANVD